MADDQKIQLLKKAIRNFKAAVDVLSEREREQLKDLILKGQVASEEDLRAYLSRMIASRSRRKEQEQKKAQERAKLQQEARREEEGGAADDAGGLERVDGPPGRSGVQTGTIDDPAKLTGRVIDAKSRKPVPFVRVRAAGTSFAVETETTGVFIWEEMPRGRQVNLEITKKGYKNLLVQYRSTLDDEQHIIAKLVSQEIKGEKKKPSSFGEH